MFLTAEISSNILDCKICFSAAGDIHSVAFKCQFKFQYLECFELNYLIQNMTNIEFCWLYLWNFFFSVDFSTRSVRVGLLEYATIGRTTLELISNQYYSMKPKAYIESQMVALFDFFYFLFVFVDKNCTIWPSVCTVKKMAILHLEMSLYFMSENLCNFTFENL